MKLTIHQAIRSKRMAQHLTQQELAERLGVSYQAVSKWERGINLPDLLLIPALCDALGISAEELMGVLADTNTPLPAIPEEPRKEP